MKPKKCKACGQLFQPARAMQKACSPACAIELNKAVRERAYKTAQAKARREDRQKRERLKTRSEWMKEAQKAFNAYIRARDTGKPCICCGLPLASGDVGGQFDAGHYRSTGSAPHLRFVEDNCHGQRKQCNRYGAGRAVDYRIGLIARIGLERVEALEADQEPRHYTIDDLKAIKAEYMRKAKEVGHE